MSTSPGEFNSNAIGTAGASSVDVPMHQSLLPAAALDALQSQIAVLDGRGVIIAVNRAWREFVERHRPDLESFGVGQDYVRICGAAWEGGAAAREKIARGVASVRQGEQDSFAVEFPCPFEKGIKWYLLTVTRIDGAEPAAVLTSHEDITARKAIEHTLVNTQEKLESRVAERTAALARSEELHRHTIESLPFGVTQIASDGVFVGANAEGLRFLGLSMDGLTKLIIPDFAYVTFLEDGSPCLVDDYPATRCLATGEPQPAKTIGVRKPDGSMEWAVFTAVPVPCPHHPGKSGAVVTFLNITERKQAQDAQRRSEEALRQAHEQLEHRVAERTAELARINDMLREQIAERTRADAALRESEERLRQMADNIGEVVWILDVATRKVLYVSPAYESIWGRTSESLYRSVDSFLDSVVPEDHVIARESFERHMIEPVDVIYRIKGRHGEIRWVRSRSRPIRDANGNTWRVTGIAEDITDLKHAEAELSRLASIVESSDDAIIGKSLDGLITSWNSGAERIYGYTPAEILRQPCQVLLPPEHRATVLPLLQRVAGGERIETFETVRVRKDGSIFHVSITLSAVRDSAGNIIGASEIERDITERKRLEEEVLQISERERRRIGQDLHDGLGQHLTGIAFLSKSLQQRLGAKSVASQPPTADESAEAGQIAELVQQAVGQTRALARGLHPVEPSSNGLMAALTELAVRTEAFFHLECAFEYERPVLLPDNVMATHLYRIAQEAVTNAVKHARAKAIRIRLEQHADAWQLSIEDDGVGLPDPAPIETGLGLRIMHYRAKMIGGILAISCARPHGTIITCRVASNLDCCEVESKEPAT
jgi:PAS domain S-box-containing protein